MWRVILCNTLFLAKFKIMLIFFDFMLSHLVIFINMQKLMYVYTGKRHVLFTFDNCIGTYSTDLTNTWVVFHIWNDMIWYMMCDMTWYDMIYAMIWYDMIWCIHELRLGLHPVAVVQYTFTCQQYTEQHNETEYTERNIHNNKNI